MKYSYMLRHVWTLKALCKVKKARHKSYILSHVYTISRVGTSIVIVLADSPHYGTGAEGVKQ